MIAEVVGSDSAAQNHEILTWCQFYAAHHGSGSGKWLSLARGKTWKTNHTESTLSSRPYTARYRAFQCAWLSRMRLYSAGNGIHIFWGGEEGDVIFFIFFKLQVIRRGNLAFLNFCIKRAFSCPQEGLRALSFQTHFPNDCLQDRSGPDHRVFTFPNVDISLPMGNDGVISKHANCEVEAFPPLLARLRGLKVGV